MLQNALVHALVLLTAAWAGHHPGFGYGLSDDKQQDGALAAYGGVAAWCDHQRLTVWRRGYAPERLGIQETGERMLDVGPGPDGATWILHPKCDKNGCVLRGFDLRTRGDRDLHLAAVAGAIWGRRLVSVDQDHTSAPSKM